VAHTGRVSKPSKTSQKSRRLYTPAATQAQVLAGTLAGKSKSKLHRETGLGRGTIRRILSQSEAQALMASYRDQTLELVPRALESINRRFDHRKATEWLAVQILKGLQVFMGKSKTDVKHFVDELQEMTDEELADYINKRVNTITVSNPGNA
jgi:hypothetical protein